MISAKILIEYDTKGFYVNSKLLVSRTLLDWFKVYFAGRKQPVVIPGAISDWNFIKVDYRKGKYCRPPPPPPFLVFLVFIYNILTDIGSYIRLFADDSSLYIIVEHPDLTARCIK